MRDGRTDGQTDGRTDGRTTPNQYTPIFSSKKWGIIMEPMKLLSSSVIQFYPYVLYGPNNHGALLLNNFLRNKPNIVLSLHTS